MDESWKSDLERWLEPSISALRHKTRARMCPVYVAGLIGAGDRNSLATALRKARVASGLLPTSYTITGDTTSIEEKPSDLAGFFSYASFFIGRVRTDLSSSLPT